MDIMDWHSIEVAPNNTSARMFGKFGESWSVERPEIDKWIIEYYKNDSEFWCWARIDIKTYKFSCEKIAMAFKLRWT